MSDTPSVTLDDVRAVAPALAAYTERAIVNGVWKRPGLSGRDRSVATVAALLAGERAIGLPHYLEVALSHGVTPGELSEIVTHVAFYAGWSSAFSAVPVLKRLFAERGIHPDQLPPAAPDLLTKDEALPGDAARAALLRDRFGATAPGLVELTDDLLYGEVWLRPGLSPRDRNLATLAALVGSGSTEFLPLYAAKAAANGVTAAEVSEMVTHLAFYVGWPTALGALRSMQASPT